MPDALPTEPPPEKPPPPPPPARPERRFPLQTVIAGAALCILAACALYAAFGP